VDQATKDKVRKIVSFQYLSDEEFETLLTICQVIPFKKDEQIIKDGEISQNLYAVVEGTVRVTVREGDKDVYICATGAGQVFGEAGMFMKVKRTADVYSDDDSLILKIHRQELVSFFNSHPQGAIKFLMVLVYSLLKKLKESNRELAYERMTDIDQSDVDEMIRDFIQ
jgi:CRP-like cAMP-binding protein